MPNDSTLQRIAPDVQLGRDTRISAFVNLYGAQSATRAGSGPWPAAFVASAITPRTVATSIWKSIEEASPSVSVS